MKRELSLKNRCGRFPASISGCLGGSPRELPAVLAQMQNGVELASSDLQGDENPPVAQNPWATQRPTLQAAGKTAHTGLVGVTLSESLKVSAFTREGAPADGVDVMFRVDGAPSSDWSFSGAAAGQPVYKTISGGLAETGFNLGTASGGYAITAECPHCCPSTVVFSVTAKTNAEATELVADGGLCELYGVAGQQMAPFRVVALNTITSKIDASKVIRYERVSFTDMGNDTSIPFPEDAKFNYKKVAGGYETATLTPGNQEGTYAVKAVCDDCLGNQSVVCHAYVHKAQMTGKLPSDRSANPFDRDPITGKPLTPVVRVQELVTSNTNTSFTTDESENLVRLKAIVLPEDFAEQSAITWNVIDDPRDNYPSPLPVQNPVPESGSKYDAIYRVRIDKVDGGRPAPLRYLVTAKAVVDDKEALSPYRQLGQDEIDKCRQEYVDYGIGLLRVPKSTFSYGLDGEFVGTPLDCYAHIYPARADEVQDLKKTRTVRVNGGYRSPRANQFVAQSKAITTSWHMFGEAIDIEIIPETAANYKELWDNVDCPELLESNSNVLLKCDANGNVSGLLKYFNSDGSLNDNVFDDLAVSGWIHMGN